MMLEAWLLPSSGPAREWADHYISTEIRLAQLHLAAGNTPAAAAAVANGIRWMAWVNPAWLWNQELNEHLPCLRDLVLLDRKYHEIHRILFGESASIEI